PGVAPRRAPPPARASAAGPDSALPGTRVPNRRAGRAAYSDGLVGGVAEGGTQLGERERLVEVGTPEGLEELQGVAPHGVARGEDDALGRARVVAREFLVHLASREVRHAKIADDDVEVARDGALQRVCSVARHFHRMPPAFERGARVVEDVRLVGHHPDAYPLPRGDRRQGGLGERGPRAAWERD